MKRGRAFGGVAASGASGAPFFYNLRAKGATTTLGPKAPSNLRTLRPPGRSILSTFLYNPLNPLNPLNPHTEGVSQGVSRHHNPRAHRTGQS